MLGAVPAERQLQQNSGVTGSQAKPASIARPQCRDVSWAIGDYGIHHERTAHCAVELHCSLPGQAMGRVIWSRSGEYSPLDVKQSPMSQDGVGRAADVEKTPHRAVFYSRKGQVQMYLYA